MSRLFGNSKKPMVQYPKIIFPNYEGRKILYDNYDADWNDHQLGRSLNLSRPPKTQRAQATSFKLAAKRAVEDPPMVKFPVNEGDENWNDHFSYMPNVRGQGNPELAERVDPKSLDVKTLRRHAKTLKVPTRYMMEGKSKLIRKKQLLENIENIHGSGWTHIFKVGNADNFKEIGEGKPNRKSLNRLARKIY
jgi:hypothetical protein